MHLFLVVKSNVIVTNYMVYPRETQAHSVEEPSENDQADSQRTSGRYWSQSKRAFREESNE